MEKCINFPLKTDPTVFVYIFLFPLFFYGLLASTREIVIIKEKRVREIEKPLHFQAFCFLFITVIIYLRRYFNRTPHAVGRSAWEALCPIPFQLQSIMDIVRGFPHSTIGLWSREPIYHIPYTIYILSFFIRYASQKFGSKWHFNMPHEALRQLGLFH